MTPSKISQEILALTQELGLTNADRQVILGMSSTKFNQYKYQYPKAVLRKDPTNTVCGEPVTTCMCFEVRHGLKL